MSRPSFFHSLLRSVLLTLSTIIILAGLVAGGFWLHEKRGAKIDDGSWLVLDLYGTIHEYDTPTGPLSMVTGGDELTLQGMLDALGKAALDDRIEGVIFQISASNNAGWAKMEELRRAVDKVQAAGKPVYAWGDALDLRALYLAAGCNKTMMPTGGYFEFRGIGRQMPYLRGVLDKLGIIPHLHKIKEYKAAAELVMDKKMSDAVRENEGALLADTWEGVLTTIGAERNLSREELLELMNYAEFTPTEARDAGLIDECIYMQELTERLADGEDRLPTVSYADYSDVSWQDVGLHTGSTIAVVHAQGNIGGRESRIDPLLGVMMGHESIIRELQRCRFDDEVKAVVFRIDSGGGESLASDLMAHEIGKLAAVKPVVVSMVDVAASGGYYIAYKATKLVADPFSVVGSIGSINGFFNMKGFYDKIGLTKDGLSIGPMAELGTDYREPTAEEWARHTQAHWNGYNEWLRDVADHRDWTFEHAKTLAYGRVFTGNDALGIGMVDAVGNLDEALALAGKLAGLDTATSPKVVHLPEKIDFLNSILSDPAGPRDPVAMAVNKVLYNQIHTQLSETIRFLQTGAQNVVR